MKEKKHLPLYGVGPYIVFGQFLITIIGIAICLKLDISYSIDILRIPFVVVGIALICFGYYLNYSAKMKSKLFENVKENKLITDGVYSMVRNPVYSCALLMCTGLVLLFNNLVLFILPVICWIYCTVFVMQTEEKWLAKMYGQEYIEYCKKVNRCIPFSRK